MTWINNHHHQHIWEEFPIAIRDKSNSVTSINSFLEIKNSTVNNHGIHKNLKINKKIKLTQSLNLEIKFLQKALNIK